MQANTKRTVTVLAARLVRRLFVTVAVTLHSVGALYYMIVSPPLHLIYHRAPPGGENSIYVPGAGFSGFWYHLGVFQTVPDMLDYDYYCYSSGCLSLVTAYMNHTLHDAFNTCEYVQKAWLNGTISRYELVMRMLDQVVPDAKSSEELLGPFLPKLHILLTTSKGGVDVKVARDRRELVDLLVQTTWIPFLTANGILRKGQDLIVDGGVSRTLHPKCATELFVPTTWHSAVHAFNPSLGRQTAFKLWEMGSEHFQSTTSTTTTTTTPGKDQILYRSNNNCLVDILVQS